jgi:hypothetical protein
MAAAVTVDLRNESSWDPLRLLASAFAWPTGWPLVAIGDIAVMIPTSASPPEGALVIVPGGLDSRTGRIRRRSEKYLGSVYQVGGSGRNLREGDLLVPPSPQLPVLYVTEAMEGALVAGSFTALRVDGSSIWVWGVLNSADGKRLRTLAASGAALRRNTRLSLLSLLIPRPPLAQQRYVEPNLRDLITLTGADEEDAPTSWWRVADLRETEWRFALATPRPELLEKGVLLESLASSLRQGRSFSDDPLLNTPGPDDIPVADASWLRTGKVRRWCASDSPRAALRTADQDVVMAATGRDANAQVAPAGYVVDTSVIAVTLKEPELARGVARYLNSRTGSGVRALRLSGSLTIRLNLRDARELRITDDIYQPVGQYDPAHSWAPPLEERLGQMLWA